MLSRTCPACSTPAVTANIAGKDALEPTVESTLLRYAAARTREDAITQADRGSYDGAAELLDRAGLGFRVVDPPGSVVFQVRGRVRAPHDLLTIAAFDRS